MKLVYRFLRFVAVAALCVAVVVPAVTYVALSLTSVQSRIASLCERELSRVLQCRVTVGGLGIVPFNRFVLRDVTVETAPGDTALTVHRLGAGVRLWSFVSGDVPTVNYVELIGLDARLSRDSIGAPLNIQGIIDVLGADDGSREPSAFDLRVNTVLLRASKISYDVLSEPQADEFDPSHIAISNLRADIRLPRVRNNDFIVSIKRMGLSERSGFRLENLTAEADVSSRRLALKNFFVTLPSSSLSVGDISLAIDGLGNIGEALRTGDIELEVSGDSYVTPADFSAFMAQLAALRSPVYLQRVSLSGNLHKAVADVAVHDVGGNTIAVSGGFSDITDAAGRNIGLRDIAISVSGGELRRVASCFATVPGNIDRMLGRLGTVHVDGAMDCSGSSFGATLAVASSAGGADLVAEGNLLSPGDFAVSAEVATQGTFDIAALTGCPYLGGVDGTVSGTFTRHGTRLAGNADVAINSMSFNGRDFTGLHAVATLGDDGIVRGNASIDDGSLAFDLDGAWSLAKGTDKLLEVDGTVARFVPSELGLGGRFPGANISASIDVSLHGSRLENLPGHVKLSDVVFSPAVGDPIVMESFALEADSSVVVLRSDYVDGEVRGRYSFPDIPATVRDVLSHSFPAMLGDAHREYTGTESGCNDFTFRVTIKNTEPVAGLLNLPVSVIYPVEVTGEVSDMSHDLALTLDAPYLRQGLKLVESTRLSAFVNGSDGSSGIDFTTAVPTKNGPMTLLLQSTGRRDYMTTGVSWKIDRARAYEGEVGAVTTFERDDDGRLLTTVNLMPGSLTFNDSTWVVNPAKVMVAGVRDIMVDGINIHRQNQFVKINGTVSDDAASLLTLDLRNFSLDYLFESLGIDKVMLGGDASGTFYASRLFSPEPMLETPGLDVTGISYNKTKLGDAVVKSRWDVGRKAVTLGAVIDQDDGRQSFIDGAIFPLRDSLDITFAVDHANIGFMHPYMEAFASDISGHASGRVRLFGNFKYIDLEGDAFADDLRMRVNFTNTYYTARDSVHFRPGLIDLSGISISDADGHTARLDGWVRHTFFKEPRFEFNISEAHNFLAYNETAKENPVWYGKIYGDGSAFVRGGPGRVDIAVDMATAPHSTFSFVLSDQEVADEYSFLTFRDKGKLLAESDTAGRQDASMELVNRLKAMVESHNEDVPSDYNISLQMRVTPDAQIILVMDPVGGDRIRAYGSGHLRMDYGSANNDLKMYGTYTLDRGDYNFTLQDVIIKDFTIDQGSEIVFNGDPYAAVLNIQAIYALNANLSDLDESFTQDRDLNRTNVPVHAVMKVNGDIRQPEISFDLDFPTLTTDVYRKVRSIISTDDMMNRQIIYLLALNRFYTPEYMSSTTKGNELVSVASSTISSQLGNMLGQISDNWHIAPTFRSDRGDFSDVEFDLALSSRLLNNRLLFNGNFGYRDNTLNTNQFIGDFDLEYILDREGMWRLKAYNRYNDQSYYLRTAHTTQGVGVVLKRDFDSFLSFIRRLRKKDK